MAPDYSKFSNSKNNLSNENLISICYSISINEFYEFIAISKNILSQEKLLIFKSPRIKESAN